MLPLAVVATTGTVLFAKSGWYDGHFMDFVFLVVGAFWLKGFDNWIDK